MIAVVQIELSPGIDLFYRDDDFTDAWHEPEAVFLLHGFGESSLAWNRWIPHLAARYRVVRPDMRGYGSSTPMPVTHAWSLDEIVNDYIKLADTLHIERFHLVGAKVGGTNAIRLAARFPERVRTLSILASRVTGKATPGGGQDLSAIETSGVEQWARESMKWRLGEDCPPEMLEGWAKLMGRTPVSTIVGFVRNFPPVDLSADLPRIACPTLVVPSRTRSTVETHVSPERIPHAEIKVMPGGSHHVAATQPDACARAVLEFIERSG